MAAGDLNDAPTIPLLINNTIDLEALNGGPLSTYAKYENPLRGDALIQSWLGKAEDDTPVDHGGVEIPVDPQPGQTEFLMQVPYDTVEQLNNGQVFYSFFLKRVTGELPEESKRIHFGIGKHGLLSAPQIKESHDFQLDRGAIVGNNVTIAVVPYTVMSNGDQVTVFWEGVKADGTPGPVVKIPPKTLSNTDTDWTNNPGQVLSWTVPKINAPVGGKITLHYEITFAAGAQANSVSAQRSILVTPPAKPPLPMPGVKGLEGTEINPGEFPGGIQVVIPIYPGIRVGDEVLVYGTGSVANKNTIQYLKIDISNIESGKIEVPIDAQWLRDNRGEVNLRYQYARPDAAGSSLPLELTIVEPLVLPIPTVDQSVEIEDRDELNPHRVLSGAYIAIPEAATIADGAEVIAYWKGFGPSGSYETKVPSQVRPLKFWVPPEVIPPNFSKIVEVTYRVAGQYADRSLQLFIQPLSGNPGIDCENMQVGSPATLKLSDIPSGGVLLKVETWAFISTEHQVRLWLTALNTDRDIIAVRQVKPEETTAGVQTQLLASDLAGIATNGLFTLHGSVSFDGGHSTEKFIKPLSLKLLA